MEFNENRSPVKRARTQANYRNPDYGGILDASECYSNDFSDGSGDDFVQGQISSDSECESRSRKIARKGKNLSQRQLRAEMNRNAILVSTNTNSLSEYTFCVFHTTHLMNFIGIIFGIL